MLIQKDWPVTEFETDELYQQAVQLEDWQIELSGLEEIATELDKLDIDVEYYGDDGMSYVFKFVKKT